MSNAPHLDRIAAQFNSTRAGAPTLDERRGLSVLTQRLFGERAARRVQLGRYIVKERLGSGGTGVVYRALDPVLERDVAIKVLRRSAETATGGDRQRVPLLHEARRVARLEHPAIVQVFSVEHDEHADIAFVVMALLPGLTLQSWLEAQPRGVTEICEKFRRAAEALEAAHAVGVVHGDFKPANVLLDAHEHPCVVDFGGRGTPHYMAPEQREQDTLSPRVDVHAFAVALDDALADHPLSRRARALLDRARSRTAEQRPGSVLTVIDAIDRPWLVRRRWLASIAAVVVIGAAAVVVQSEQAPQACALHALALPDGLPPQAQTAAAAFVASWNETSATACERDERQAAVTCLRRALSRWERAAELVAQAPDATDAALVIEAVARPRECLAEGAAPAASSPLRERFEQVDIELRAAQDLGTLGEHHDALVAKLEGLRRAALEGGDEGVEADAALLLALMALRDGRVDESAETFGTAYLLASRAGDPTTEYNAAANLVWLYGGALHDVDRAQDWLVRARSAAHRREDGGAELLLLEGAFASDQGAFAESIAFYDRAEALFDQDTPLVRWTELLCGRGRAKRNSGRFEAALLDFEASMQRMEAVLPSDSYQYGETLNGLGTTLRELGRLEEAAQTLERLLVLLQREAPRSPDVASVRGNLAQLYADRGEHARALEQFREVYDIFVALVGPKSPVVSMTRFGIAEQLFATHQDEEARVEAEAALRWNVPEPYAASSRLLLAKIALRNEEGDEALERLRDLLAQDELDPRVREDAQTLLDEASSARR